MVRRGYAVRTWSNLAAAIVAVVTLSGCRDRCCTPGTHRLCGCTSGKLGTQQCAAEGDGWQECLIDYASPCGAAASCDDPAQLPCPAKGIGVEPLVTLPPGECMGPGGICMAVPIPGCPEATDICVQIADYKRFACAEPQICPDLGGLSFQAVRHLLAPGAAPSYLGFLISNCSTGSRRLEISKAAIYGDERCSFANLVDADIESKTLEPGATMAIRVRYQPTAPGEDHAELRLYSNAQNFPELRLRICGRAVESAATAICGDAGPGCPAPRCLEQSNLAACHK